MIISEIEQCLVFFEGDVNASFAGYLFWAGFRNDG